MEKEKRIEKIESTVIDYLTKLNVGNGKIPAFETYGGSRVDYNTLLDEYALVYAKAFTDMGVKKGEYVTIVTGGGTLDTLLYFAGLNKIGAVAQYVNPNYFKFNPKKYIDETNTNLMICLDQFFPLLKNEINQTNVKQVMFSSISEYEADLFKIKAPKIEISDADKKDGVSYMNLSEFIKLGENSRTILKPILYVPGMPAVVTYTSGTTGNPKGVIHTNDTLNHMLATYQIAGGFGAARAERNLVVIPLMYLTSFMHSVVGPLSVGATNVLQSVYNPYTLADDLLRTQARTVVASKAHFINMEDSKLPRGALSATKFAYSGGEAYFRETALRIIKTLEYFGIEPLINCYGATEFGTMVMYNKDLPNRVNESGMLIPGVEVKILDMVTGKEIREPGKRGEIYISTDNMMAGYLNNPEADAKFFTDFGDGKKWGRIGDVAEIIGEYKGNTVYTVSGRIGDSFADAKNQVVYLFDTEEKVETIPGIRQAEVVAVTIDGKKVPIVHVILDKGREAEGQQILKRLDAYLKAVSKNPSEIPYAYKIRDSFATSPISGKRDYEILKFETDGFLMLNEFGNFEPVTIEPEESKTKNELLHSQILIKTEK